MIVDGRHTALVTIGHCARALRRTPTRLKQWEQMGIFPPAPFRSTRNQQRLYPTEFLRSIRLIAEQDYFGTRLDRANWVRFQSEVWAAHNAALAPLHKIGAGVVEYSEDATPTPEGQQG